MKPASKKTTGAADEPAAKAEQTKKKTVAKKAKSPVDEQPIAAVAKAHPKAAKTAKATKSTAPAKAADAKPKATKQKTVATTDTSTGEIRLIAHVDVGLGNTLFFRGWGGGLRWDAGTPAVCVGDGRWDLTLNKVAEPVHFKVLINDEVWSDGPDLTAIPSGMLEFNPAFG